MAVESSEQMAVEVVRAKGVCCSPFLRCPGGDSCASRKRPRQAPISYTQRNFWGELVLRGDMVLRGDRGRGVCVWEGGIEEFSGWAL